MTRNSFDNEYTRFRGFSVNGDELLDFTLHSLKKCINLALFCQTCKYSRMNHIIIMYDILTQLQEIYTNGKKKRCIAKMLITQKYAADEHDNLQTYSSHDTNI